MSMSYAAVAKTPPDPRVVTETMLDAAELEDFSPHIDSNKLLIGLYDSDNELFKRWYHVLSPVLEVASPVMANLIRTQSNTVGEHRVLVVEGVVSEALDCIFSVLHHWNIIAYKSLEIDQIVSVAGCSSKLGFNKALSSWVYRWYEPHIAQIACGNHIKPDTLGPLLESAKDFEAPEQFSKVWMEAVRKLSPADFTPAMHDKPLVPEGMKDALSIDVAALLTRMTDDISNLDGPLQIGRTQFATRFYRCPDCGRRQNTSSCSNCCIPFDDQDVSNCNKQSRIADFFNIFMKAGMWPPSVPRQKFSANQLAQHVYVLNEYLEHSCTGEHSCPLRFHITGLSQRLNRTLKQVPEPNLKASGFFQG
ncbi:hypothetical protein CkaCkLH20_06628 [Colletotrichum karsti]|uniref:BTB domain-containing protein n=1 Tax=Colletotrichum karsti TaxID=1095194 RepID=A0A9P6I5Y5_9PEZI|nr:uncharacterized protein CkaCkLH20_06628 [Colletotrichum karsti]KAF9875696.1 hypothetical protein CkaCkLH20_06628 [Colletotrichum karsti]